VGDLAKIEGALNELNLFEALGVVRSELRHSDFLAFLLDPSSSHGLGDIFLRRFLQSVVLGATDRKLDVSALQFGVWDLKDCIVERERANIDVLIVSDRNRFVVLIENKVDTGEHSDQLQRYETAILRKYVGYALLRLFLTPSGHAPSHSRYVAVSYGTVCDLIEEVLRNHASSLNVDLVVLLRHYAKMIRTHFMNDSELVELAVAFYRRHQKALDYIYEKRPDKRAFITDVLTRYVDTAPELILEESTEYLVRFVHRDWPDRVLAGGDKSWLISGRSLAFEFENYGSSVKLSLFVGPGEARLRARLVEWANGAQPPFRPSSRASSKFKTIWSRNFADGLELLDSSVVETRLSMAWSHFRTSELPELHERIMEFVDSVRTNASGV